PEARHDHARGADALDRGVLPGQELVVDGEIHALCRVPPDRELVAQRDDTAAKLRISAVEHRQTTRLGVVRLGPSAVSGDAPGTHETASITSCELLDDVQSGTPHPELRAALQGGPLCKGGRSDRKST